MAVSYRTKKCDSCAGSLEYIADKKIWRCRYCGQEIVREEQYDGLFTIKNVVRQTILDAAYRRIDGARSNLTECEKIDSQYVGTNIARICYRMASLITPNGCREEEVRGMYQRLKDDYSQLCSRNSGVGEDEETMYAYIAENDGAADAFAFLILVFDSLGDRERPAMYYDMLDISKVYSKECNKDLLTYCLKNGKADAAHSIIANKGNIDARTAMDTLLTRCPDGPDKQAMITELMTENPYSSQDREQIEAYLQGSDSSATKAALLRAGKDANFLPGMDTIIQHVLAPASPEELDTALSGINIATLHDQDLYTLLDYALSEPTDKTLVILRHIAASGKFVAVNSRVLSALFLNTSRPADERIALWQELQQFRVDPKAVELTTGEYLVRAAESREDRAKILGVLLQGVHALSPSVVEQYLFNCRADSEAKAQTITSILSLPNMRPVQFGGTMGKYLMSGADDAETRAQVIDAMIGAGLTLTPVDILNFIVASRLPANDKVEMLRRVEKNGCKPGADALSIYLEQCYRDFSPTMFAYLTQSSTVISENAIRNFVLACRDNPATKAQNAAALASRQSVPFGSTPCQITHASRQISCSLVQAYLLLAPDPYETCAEMLRLMSAHTKLTTDVLVNGSMTRFKKYLKDNRAQLSQTTERLCTENNLFSFF